MLAAVDNLICRYTREVTERPVIRGPHDDPILSDEELIAQRTAWFQRYTQIKNIYAPPSDGPYSCPCCGHVELTERGGYEICGECGWEDDGQDDHDSSVIRGGPNGAQSLDQARADYAAAGGTPQPHRPPTEPR
jgi:cysteine-rich CPCC protein